MTKELHKKSILELNKGYKKRTFSPLEVIKEIIDNINKKTKK